MSIGTRERVSRSSAAYSKKRGAAAGVQAIVPQLAVSQMRPSLVRLLAASILRQAADYNRFRPQSSLGYQTPAGYAVIVACGELGRQNQKTPSLIPAGEISYPVISAAISSMN